MTRQHGPRPEALPLLAHPLDATSVIAVVCVLISLSVSAGLLAWWTTQTRTQARPNAQATQAGAQTVDEWSCPTCDDADERCPEWEARR